MSKLAEKIDAIFAKHMPEPTKPKYDQYLAQEVGVPEYLANKTEDEVQGNVGDIVSIHWVADKYQLHVDVMGKNGIETYGFNSDPEKYKEFEDIFREPNGKHEANLYFFSHYKEEDALFHLTK